jgi:hypothetical protein
MMTGNEVMQSRSIPIVTLYIRIADEKGDRRYERVNRRNSSQ